MNNNNKYVFGMFCVVVFFIFLFMNIAVTESSKKKDEIVSNFLSSIEETNYFYAITDERLEFYGENDLVCKQIYSIDLRPCVVLGDNIRYCIIQIKDKYIIPSDIQVHGNGVVIVNNMCDHNYKVFVGED